MSQHSQGDSFRNGAEKWGPVGSLVAIACCLGGGALVAVLAPLGLAFLVTDWVFVPLAVFFLAVTLWGLNGSRYRHKNHKPLVVAAFGAVLTVAGLWIWWLIVVAGIGMVEAAAIWNLIALRQ